MEDVLEVYHRPYHSHYPVVCLDESSKQLIGEVQAPIPAAPGHPVLMDDEYVRNGVATIFLDVEPLSGQRNVTITERRTQVDWARYVKEMLDHRYPHAEKVIAVIDLIHIQQVKMCLDLTIFIVNSKCLAITHFLSPFLKITRSK